MLAMQSVNTTAPMPKANRSAWNYCPLPPRPALGETTHSSAPRSRAACSTALRIPAACPTVSKCRDVVVELAAPVPAEDAADAEAMRDRTEEAMSPSRRPMVSIDMCPDMARPDHPAIAVSGVETAGDVLARDESVDRDRARAGTREVDGTRTGITWSMAGPARPRMNWMPRWMTTGDLHPRSLRRSEAPPTAQQRSRRRSRMSPRSLAGMTIST